MQLRTLGWLLLAQTCGGVSPALTKLALDGFGPWSLVVVRQCLGTLLLLALWNARSRSTPATRPNAPFTPREWGLVFLLGWAGFALPQILNAIGLDLSTATHGALLIPLEPIGILLGGALFLGERISAARGLAIAFGIAGATTIVLSNTGGLGAGNLRGDVLMALGHLAWAIYTLAAKPLLERHDPLRVTLWASALSSLPLLPLALQEPFDLERAQSALLWIVLLAFVATVLGTFAWNRALSAVQAGTMAAFIFVQPVVGIAVGVLFLGESMGWRALMGAALILSGVALTLRRV